MENDEDDLPLGQQVGFSLTYDIVKGLVEKDGFSPAHVGEGVLIAAISCLKREWEYDRIAALLYQYADFNAVRDKLPEGK